MPLLFSVHIVFYIFMQMAEEEDARTPEKPFIKCHLKIPFKV